MSMSSKQNCFSSAAAVLSEIWSFKSIVDASFIAVGSKFIQKAT